MIQCIIFKFIKWHKCNYEWYRLYRSYENCRRPGVAILDMQMSKVAIISGYVAYLRLRSRRSEDAGHVPLTTRFVYITYFLEMLAFQVSFCHFIIYTPFSPFRCKPRSGANETFGLALQYTRMRISYFAHRRTGGVTMCWQINIGENVCSTGKI